MTYVAKSLGELRVGDQVQLAVDEVKYPPIEVATWYSYDRDALCVGNNVYEALTKGNDPSDRYQWYAGEVVYKGPESLHITPLFWEFEKGPHGYAVHAADVFEVDLTASATFAAIIVDNRDGTEQLPLFFMPGTIFMGANGTFPLAVVDRQGMVRVVITAEGEAREGAAHDFDAALLNSEWGRLWSRVVVTDAPPDETLAQGLELLDYAMRLDDADKEPE